MFHPLHYGARQGEQQGDVMVRLLAVLAASFVLALTPAHSQDILSFGMGNSSCANWKLNPDNDRVGSNWILGFWSGLNAASTPSLVGLATDAPAIIAEVALICAAKPLMLLQASVLSHYERVRAEEAVTAARKSAPSK
jgi:hypothetical protein